MQRSGEGTIKYIIIMKDQFLRLPNIPPETEHVRIIKNNLLPRRARSLTLHKFDSVSEPKDACSDLETVDENLNSHDDIHPYDDSNGRDNLFNRFSRQPNYHRQNPSGL